MPGSAFSPIEDIKSRLDIIEVISLHVSLKKAGRNYKGLCPFHNEKTPSFVVFPGQGTYHCFGCNAGGDIFTFVMKTLNLDFSDALRMLAEKAGVELPERQMAQEDREAHQRLLDLMSAAAGYFNHLLLHAEAAASARAYLERREISRQTIETFQLGYALDEWESLGRYLGSKGYKPEEVLQAGLAVQREGDRGQYDRFRGRVIYPIRNLKGQVVGFGGRVLDDSHPKYLNSSDSPVFTKGANLYGIDQARQAIIEAGAAVVVEGYMDVLAAHQRGFRNVVASLGTAITEEQLRLLKRYSKNIVLALDPDTAGAEATLRGLDVARQSLDRVTVAVPTPKRDYFSREYIRYEYKLDANLRIATMPDGKDPDDVLRADPQEWARLIEAAAPVVDYYLSAVLAQADLSNPKGIATAVSRLAPILAEVPDPTARAVYTQRLADRLKLDGRRLSERVAQERRRMARGQRPQAQQQAPESPPAPQDVGPSPDEEPPAEMVASRSNRSTPISSPDRMLEQYLVLLALSYPAVRSILQDATQLMDEIGDAACREVLTRRLDWEAEWSLESFTASLDSALQPFVVELTQRMGMEPELPYPLLQREVREAAAELKRRNLRRRIQDLQYLKREAEEAGDTATVRQLIAQTDELLARLEPFDTQARAKALVWR